MLIPHEKDLTLMVRDGDKLTPVPVVGVMVEDTEKAASGTVVSKPIGWKVQIDRELYPADVGVGDYVTATAVTEPMSKMECIRAGFHEVTKVVERDSPVSGYPYCKVVELS